jgi:hypothetical protein
MDHRSFCTTGKPVDFVLDHRSFCTTGTGKPVDFVLDRRSFCTVQEKPLTYMYLATTAVRGRFHSVRGAWFVVLVYLEEPG